MQRDDGLPGAWSALDDENAVQAVADDAVLVRLDGGDDVAHPAGPGLAERRQQRGLAGQVGLVDGVQVEHVVVQADDPPARGPQVPAAGDAVPLHWGSPVERLRRLGAPVGEQQIALGAAQREPADIQAIAVIEVQPAEAQIALGRFQLGAPFLILVCERIAL